MEFKPLPAADTSHGSTFANNNRPGERSYGPWYRLFRQGGAVEPLVNTVPVVMFFKSTFDGFEFELTALATDNLTVNLGYGYTRPRTSDGKDPSCTPRYTGNLALKRTLPLNWDWEFVSRVDYRRVGPYFSGIQHTKISASAWDQPKYGPISSKEYFRENRRRQPKRGNRTDTLSRLQPINH